MSAHVSETTRQVEQESRKSEATYRSLFELSPVAIYLLDAEGNFLSVNPAGEQLLKTSAKTILGTNIVTTYLPWELAPQAIPAEKSRGSSRLVRNFLRRDGSTIPVEILLSPMLPSGRQVVIQDISERRRAESVLEGALDEAKKVEDQLQLVLNSIPTMVWSESRDGTNDFCNQRCLDHLGISADQVASYDWKTGLHPDDLARVKQAFQSAAATGTMYEVDKRLRVADGSYRWFQTRAVPLRDAKGEIVRWYGVDTDVEDLKRAQEKLAEHARQLRQFIALNPLQMFIWEADASASFGNRASADYLGPIPPTLPMEFLGVV